MIEKSHKDNYLKKLPRKFLILCLISVLGFAYWYFFDNGNTAKKENGQEDSWMVNNFKPTAINGSIISIEKADNFQTIRIKNYNDVLSYGISPCKENQELLEFIAMGDSVIKRANDFTITVLKSGSAAKNFSSLYCP